jgi:anti-sigma B factor antagonist
MQNALAYPRMKVIRLQGNINVENALKLKQQLAEVVSDPENSSLMVDMTQVSALDSAGLMALVSTLTLSQRLNKQFGLFGVSPSLRIIFELTQLDRVFDIAQGEPGSEPMSEPMHGLMAA